MKYAFLKYVFLSLFLTVLLSSSVLADGRGRGRGHHKERCYNCSQRWEKQAFKRGRSERRFAYRVPAYPRYGYYRAYPVYPAYPPPVYYDYYEACPPPPPPAYGPYYRRGRVHGRIGVEIDF